MAYRLVLLRGRRAPTLPSRCPPLVCLSDRSGGRPSRRLVVHVVGSDTRTFWTILRGKGSLSWRSIASTGAHPTATRSRGPFDWRRRARTESSSSAIPIWPCWRTPEPSSSPIGSIGAKPVDAPVPPLDVVLEVFAVAGLPRPPTVDAAVGLGRPDGGGKQQRRPLSGPRTSCCPDRPPAWAQWARWLLDRIELLGQWRIYIDQVAMALALRAEGIDSAALDVRWNTPTHDASRISAGRRRAGHHPLPPGSGPGRPAQAHVQPLDQQAHRRGQQGHRPRVGGGPTGADPGAVARSGSMRPGPRRGGSDPCRAIAAALLGALGPSSVLEFGEPGQEVTKGLVNAHLDHERTFPGGTATEPSAGPSR